MAWIKRNLFLVLGAVVVLVLMGFAGFYHLVVSKDLAPIGTEEIGTMEVPDIGF